MSGSSLDGLDIAYVQLEETRGNWSFELLQAVCIPYNEEWQYKLRHASQWNAPDLLRLHTAYGRWLGTQVHDFMQTHDLEHKVHFIASHGHTVFHEPEHHTTFQLGDGAALAAAAGLPVISDLRALDVALGGQGAPIVPIGDRLLFGQYDYLLNIGGIANLTVKTGNTLLAFDVCPANQVLNTLAAREGFSMDADGAMAAGGKTMHDVLNELNKDPYYMQPPPKSLSNENARQLAFPALQESNHSTRDLLHTAVMYIATQAAAATRQFPHNKDNAAMLVTGGGAFNHFLVSQISKQLADQRIAVTVPDEQTVKFKEAIVMALIGTLRWREEVNVLSSVTGAVRDSCGGALWMA